MKIIICLLALLPLSIARLHAQATDSTSEATSAFALRELYAVALGEQRGMPFLRDLTQQVGARPAGSAAYAQAVAYASDTLTGLGLQVQLQDVSVSPWQSLGPAQVTAYFANGRRGLRCLTLGGSGSTGPTGVRAPVIEVRSLDEVDSFGAEVNGKIVFFNRAFDPGRIQTFDGYGGAVDQRVYGPARAAAHGAVGVVVRSMTPNIDAVPHTGITVFEDATQAIPAVALATLDAEELHRALAGGEAVELFMSVDAAYMPTATDHNVIADWRVDGSSDSLILLGAHLDSWHVGEGAHDDGTGVAQTIEAVRLLQAIGYRPRHTIRIVLFANEEGGLDGGRAYWKLCEDEPLVHLAALESDRGGFGPRGFTVDAPEGKDAVVGALTASFQPLLEPYGITFRKGGGGADISGLGPQGAILFGLDADPSRYFDLHHSELDVFGAVNAREFESGAAAMASLVMLLDGSL